MDRRPVRRLALIGAAVSMLLALAGPSWAAQQDLQIREIDASGFPRVGVTVSLEEPAPVTSQEVQVFEDGVEVEPVSVRPLEESGRPVDVVLALDVSGSMIGEPMVSAINAARRFVQTVQPGVRVGLVTFSDGATVVQGLTDQPQRLLQPLQGLSAGGETALYDAVSRAASMFSGDAQRNIVLLSDGGDTASAQSLQQAADEVSEAGATVFSVGWRTSETDIAVLRTLSKETGGRYASAGSADVESLYRGLAAELSNQYVLEYGSKSSGGNEISISVEGSWGNDTALVLFPKEPAPRSSSRAPSAEPHRPPLLRGTWGLALSVGLVFGAVALVVASAIGIPVRRRRRRQLARRMGKPGSGPSQEEDGSTRGGMIPDPLVAAGQRVAESMGMAERLDRKLERAGLSIHPGEYVAGAVLAALLVGTAGGLLTQNLLIGVLFALVGAMVPVAAVSVTMRRRLNRLQGQVVDVLMILASSLRAGHSFLQALDLVGKEISEPAAGEFTRAVSEIRLGRPVDEALSALGARMGSEDFDWAMMAVNIQREVGGNLAEVLDTVAETLRDREGVRRQVKVLAAEGKLSARILTALPFLVGLYVAKINPGYLNLLFSTRLGLLMLVAASILMTLGILLMRKMVRINV
jgi:tight adherence protein B